MSPATSSLERSAIARVLEQARARLGRPGPLEVAAMVASGALLVDIRPASQRQEHGEVPGALIIERNVLEWRLDPSSPDRHPEAGDAERPVVLFCQAGYASSLAAVSLQDLGLVGATDLDGGFEAWVAAGLPVKLAAQATT